MESGDRSAFLERLGRRLSSPAPAATLRAISPWDGTVKAIGYCADLADPPGQFQAALAAVSGESRLLRDAEDRRGLVAEICRSHGVARAVVSRDPECEGMVEVLRDLGVEAGELASAEQAADADLGITGAAYGIALTGSVVVDAARAGGRTASLLPAVHLALLRAENLVATPGDLLRAVSKGARDLPSNLVIITGPSRSADIELQLTLGVHGPRALFVGLLAAVTTPAPPRRRSRERSER